MEQKVNTMAAIFVHVIQNDGGHKVLKRIETRGLMLLLELLWGKLREVG